MGQGDYSLHLTFQGLIGKRGAIHPYSEEGATVADFRPSSGFHSCGLATLLSWSTGFFIAYSWIVVYLWVVEWCFIVKNLPIFEAVKRQG